MPVLLGGLSADHVPDAVRFAVAVAALAGCIIWFSITAWLHRRHMRAIPVRIHVAGTRGKSTTTRLIAAGLRAGGRRVLAKTTGTEPRLILPDGSERPWPRRGPASVREQMRLFALAARAGADAVVVECMAIRPEMVAASETHLVRATAAVITNTRVDHVEELGDEPEAAADAARWAIPVGGRLFVGAEAATPALQSFAARRRAEVTVVEADGTDALAADRALALAVCAAHGVAAQIAGPAMDAAAGDPGRFFERRLAVDGKTVRFANAFACNDVASLALLWPAAKTAAPQVVLLNARRDRPLRTRHFLAFLAAQTPRPLLFVAGDPLAYLLARRAGFEPGTVRRLRVPTPAAALSQLADPAPSDGVIWGIGNYRGLGAALVAEATRHVAPC
jgi:poly-gamma-glutamate synthase PgsB/CapB